MDHHIEPNSHGAGRVVVHETLGALPPAAAVLFTWDGVAISGREGEPIAAAILAAGGRVLRTMPRFDDPRGGYCLVGRCTDCLMIVDGVPNVRVCVTPVTAGMDVRTQLGLGGAEADAGPGRSSG